MSHDVAVPENRSEVRKLIRGQRAQLVVTNGGPDVAESLLRTLAASGALHPTGQARKVGAITIASYLPMPAEPNVSAISTSIRAAGGRVLLPIPLTSRRLGWATDSGKYQQSAHLPVRMPAAKPEGIGAEFLVATGVSLMLVPALAVDRSGTRLGQGGGYYDVLLRELAPKSCRCIAVVLENELLPADSLPRAAHDWPIAEVLTPTEFVCLSVEAPAPG